MRRLAVVVLILAGAMVRFWPAAEDWQRPAGMWRQNHYVDCALTYARDGLFHDGLVPRAARRNLAIPDYYVNQPPLYPMLMAGLFRLLGENYWGSRLPDLAASLLVLVCLWRLAARGEKEFPGVSLLVLALGGFLPGLVLTARVADLVAAPSALAGLAIILAYVRYRERPDGRRLGVLAGVASLGLSLCWPALITLATVTVHWIFWGGGLPDRRRAIVLAWTPVVTLFGWLAFVYMAPEGGLFGLARFVRQVLYHSGGSSAVELHGVLENPAATAFRHWRWMATAPVMVLSVGGLLGRDGGNGTTGIFSVYRLLFAAAALHTVLYFGAVPVHWFILTPMIAAMAFGAAVTLAWAGRRYPATGPAPVLAAAVLSVAGILGVHWRLAAEERFYDPVNAYYGSVRAELARWIDEMPGSGRVTVGTNLWTPRHFGDDVSPRLRLVRVTRPDLLPYFSLDAYFAAVLPDGRDLTPAGLSPVFSDEVLALTGHPPLATDEEFRWIRLQPEPPAASETLPPLEIDLLLDESFEVRVRPGISLPDTVVGLLEAAMPAHEFIEWLPDRIEVSAGPEEVRFVYRERYPGELRQFDGWKRFSRWLGGYGTIPVRGRLVVPDGRAALFYCPFPGRTLTSCRME